MFGFTQKLSEAFNKQQLKDDILSFDVTPKATDVTLEAWTLRLALYGRLRYKYKNTEERVNKDTTFNHFMDVMEDAHVMKTLGSWNMRKEKDNEVSFTKRYMGMDGRTHEEIFIVIVDLRPEVKRLLELA